MLGRVLVTYIYWSDAFNEWISESSERIQPDGSQTFRDGGVLRLGHRVEACDTTNKWLEGEVIEVYPDRVRIHYRNWHPKFDEDLPRNRFTNAVTFAVARTVVYFHWLTRSMPPLAASCSPRIRPYGRSKQLAKAKPRPVARVTSLRSQGLVDRKRRTTAVAFEQYEAALAAQGLRVEPCDGDGNCLFRSVAHQERDLDDTTFPSELSDLLG